MNNEQNQAAEETNSAVNSTHEKIEPADSGTKSETNTNPENLSVAETVKSTAQDVIEQAKDTAGQAYDFAAEKASSAINDQKSNLSSGLSGVAESIRQVGQNLRDGDEQTPVTKFTAQYGETISRQIDNIAGYFEKKDLPEIVRDVESFARRQPAIFIGASFAAGLLLARFLKSSGNTNDLISAKTNQSKDLQSNNQNKSIDQMPQNAS